MLNEILWAEELSIKNMKETLKTKTEPRLKFNNVIECKGIDRALIIIARKKLFPNASAEPLSRIDDAEKELKKWFDSFSNINDGESPGFVNCYKDWFLIKSEEEKFSKKVNAFKGTAEKKKKVLEEDRFDLNGNQYSYHSIIAAALYEGALEEYRVFFPKQLCANLRGIKIKNSAKIDQSYHYLYLTAYYAVMLYKQFGEDGYKDHFGKTYVPISTPDLQNATGNNNMDTVINKGMVSFLGEEHAFSQLLFEGSVKKFRPEPAVFRGGPSGSVYPTVLIKKERDPETEGFLLKESKELGETCLARDKTLTEKFKAYCEKNDING